MNTHDSLPPTDLIAQVVDAFEQMPIPAGPATSETLDFITRSASVARGRDATSFVPARRWPNRRQLVAAGGVGLAGLLGAAVWLIVLHPPRTLSAMERVAKELIAVRSYSYRLRWESHFSEAGRPTTTKGDGAHYWQAPDAFSEEMTIVKITGGDANAKPSETEIARFATVFPAGKPGLLIDHYRKTYQEIQYEPTGSRTYPWDMLRMIREGSYDVVRDLGSKSIGAVNAHGFVLKLKNPHDVAVRDPVELWVDERTDLPIEFHYAGTNEGTTYSDCIFDFRWNIELDPKLFEPVAPAGYTNITPPDDQPTLDEIAAALRLYAALADGHYPRAKTIDTKAIVAEMLRHAEIDPAAQPDPAVEKRSEEIKRAAAAFDQLARVLLSPYHAAYFGLKVGPPDKDKVLIWWAVPEGKYLVYFGDLRRQIIGDAKAKKLRVGSDFIIEDAEQEREKEQSSP